MTPPLATIQVFDYASFAETTAAKARAVAERIRERTEAAIIQTGLGLIEVKGLLEHGAFGDWLRAEFGMSARTAENYMSAAR